MAVAIGRDGTKRTMRLVAVMGPTGSGKSSFINAASGTAKNKVGHKLKSETNDVQTTEFELDPHNHVMLIDTPGFDDTKLSDADVLQKIANFMQSSYEDGLKLTGVVYLREMTETRMRGSAVKNLRMFKELCGRDSLKNVVLVTTKWDSVDPQVGLDREKELKENWWKDMMDVGCRLERHNGKAHSAQAIIRKMLPRSSTVLQMQRELVDEKKNLSETTAGKTIVGELKLLQIKNKGEIQKTIADLTTEHDKKVARLLKMAKRELEEANAKAEKDHAAILASRDAEVERVKQQVREKLRKRGFKYGAKQVAKFGFKLITLGVLELEFDDDKIV